MTVIHQYMILQLRNNTAYRESRKSCLIAPLTVLEAKGRLWENILSNVFWKEARNTVRDDLVYGNKNLYQLKRIDLI